jgi:hypothetical protein
MARIRVGNEEVEFVSKSDGIIELEQGQEIPAAIFADELGRVKFRDRDSVSIFMSTLAALGGNIKQIDAAAGPPSNGLPSEVVVYIDLDTLRLYKRAESGWGAGLNLRGEAGQQGQQGERGRTILYGETNPNVRIDLDDALIGDMYAETGPDNNPEHQLWVKKQSAFSGDGITRLLQWERIGRPYGRIPEDGVPGQRGRSIFEGTSNPNTPVGLDAIEIQNCIDGDLYIETDRFVVWKKIDGVWHERGQSFKGVNGQDGINGARGNGVYEGTLNPNSLEMQSELSDSQIGDVYINTATYVVWKKKRVTGIHWEESGTTFKGSDGTSGNTIFQGAGNPNLGDTPKPQGFNNAKFGDAYLDTTTHKVWKYTSENSEAHWTSVGEPYKGTSLIQGKGDPNYFALLESEPVNDISYPDKQYDWYRIRNANVGDAYFDVDDHDIWIKEIRIEDYREDNPDLNLIWIKKGKNLTGPAAKTLVLESTSYFIGYDKEGLNPAPDSFTLTANTRGYPESGVTYKFGILTKDSDGNIVKTLVDESDTSSIDINLLDPEVSGSNLSIFFGNPPAPKTYYVDVYVSNEFEASDTITVLGVREGTNPLNVILSNETHVFPSDTEGNINSDVYYLGATDIYAYVGAEILEPKTEADYAASNNCYKVKIESLNGIKASNEPTNQLAASIVEGQFLSNIESIGGGNSKFICFPFDWTSETKSASIVYKIYIKTSFVTDEQVLTKTQSFSRLSDGNRGKSSLQGTGDPNEISRTSNPFTKTSWGVYSNSTFGVPTIEAERDYEEVIDANIGDKYIDLSTSLTYIKLESSWQQNQIGLLSNVEKKNQSAFSIYRSYMGKNWRVTSEYDSIGIWGDDDTLGALNFTSFRKNCSSKFIDVSNSSGEDFYRISTVGISSSLINSENEASIEIGGLQAGAIGVSNVFLDTKYASRMRAKIRRTPGVNTSDSNYSWVGRVEFLTFDGLTLQTTYETSRRVTQSLTIFDSTKNNQNEWIVVEWDLSVLPAWKNKTIVGIKWYIFDKAENSIDVEWIIFGNPNFSPSITYNSIRQNDTVSGRGWVVPSHDIGLTTGPGAEVPVSTTSRLVRTKTITNPTMLCTAPGYSRNNYVGITLSDIEIDDSNNISGVNRIGAKNLILGKGFNDYSYIDFMTVSTENDYNARIIRNLTENGSLIIANKGTGGITLDQQGIGNIRFRMNDSLRMFIDGSNGKVGIGTDEPTTLLDVAGSTNSDSFWVNKQWQLYSNTGDDNDLVLRTADLNRFYFSNSGLLYVLQDSATAGSSGLHFKHNTGGNWYILADDAEVGRLKFSFKANDSSASTLKASIAGDGENAKQLNFTGQHKVLSNASSLLNESYIGLIVSSCGQYDNIESVIDERNNITIDESLPIVKLSEKRQDKTVFGVISNFEDSNINERIYKIGSLNLHSQKESPKDNRLIINSLGEGAIWVTNVNGSLENGDYITSCEIPGYGMKQDSEGLMNYTVAKITCDCDFNLDSKIYYCEEFEWEGETYRKAFVGCTYHCG